MDDSLQLLPLFICDPPLGRWEVAIQGGDITPEAADRIRKSSERQILMGMRYIVFEPGLYSITLTRLPGEWPDAEFCAA